jgi:hypothetical protein
MLRWILHRPDGTIARGDGDPPIGEPGELHLVGQTEDESASLVGGKLIRRGARANQGRHRLQLGNGNTLVSDVDGTGRAKPQVERGKGNAAAR